MAFAGSSYLRLSTRLIPLLLAAIHLHFPLTDGQLVGVSLRLRGVTLSSDSLVDVDDILQLPESSTATPENNDEYHNQSLLCLTDLEDCCNAPRERRGSWHYPDRSKVIFNAGNDNFRRNRGPNEVVNDQQFYGSVRLFRRGNPTERGRFRCELPNAANPFVNQTIYANILDIGAVSVMPSGPSTAGENSTLVCSASIVAQMDTPPPHFQWFFGPNNNSLPFRTPRTTNSGTNMYSSTLQFSPLSQSHVGMYTCRLGGNARLAERTTLFVNAPSITVKVTANFNAPLMVGQTDNTLTCDVLGADNLNPTITHQWTRDDGNTLTQVGTDSTLTLSSLKFSDGGDYTCNVTVNSTFLNSNISTSSDNSQRVTIQIPDPQSVTVTSSLGGIVLNGSDVTLTCSVQMNQNILPSELSLLMVTAELTRPDGLVLVLLEPDISGANFTYTAQVSSFGDSDVGNYTCNASVGLRLLSTYLTGTGQLSNTIQVIIGVPPTTVTSGAGGPGRSAGSSIGAFAGGVVASIVALGLVTITLVVFSYCFMRRRRSILFDKQKEGSKSLPVAVTYSKQENVTLNGVHVGSIDKPTIMEFPSDTKITEGEGVYFKIEVSGEPQPTVTWYHDGEPIRADYAREIESDGSLTIPSTELKHSGVYKAVAANTHGSEEREIKLLVDTAGDETVFSKPIPIPEFGKYVAELHTNSNKPFKDLFQALDTGEEGHCTEYATNRESKPLNRFGNIVVYDDNRIVLKPLSDISDCQRDYINACYVDGYSIPSKFIATQGPIPKTVVDFWRLIWQERSPTIVMVTNIKESSHTKCQQYWPESGKKDFGPFQVIITDQQIFADYTIRTLSISLVSTGHSHKVTQYHFTAWPDHGVPDYATPILAFHKRVKAQHHPSRGPMVVHCSAGVGRTGTLITIDNVLEQIEKEQVVDIPGAITKIRQRRMKMVQTHEQFMFIHDAILESVTCGDTQIAATNLKVTITKMKKSDDKNQPHGFKYQLKILEQVSPNPEEVHCGGALGYPERNRSQKFLPADRWRVFLKGERKDYINAVNINGYKHKRAFIVAEGPMQSTVRNFWKMIYERNCAVVVMTSALIEGGQEASAQYWPDSGIAHYGEFAVDLLGEEKLAGFMIRKFSVTLSKSQKTHQVTQFQITCWRPDGCCSNLKSVTDVIEEMTKVQMRSGNKPIVVHCSDTVTRSGMFCAIATTIERCKTEGVVDVFQVVKALRVQKPGAVPSVEQYKLIFDAVLVFLDSFDTYANFQRI